MRHASRAEILACSVKDAEPKVLQAEPNDRYLALVAIF